MGNHHSGTYSGLKPRKNVHWKSAERPVPPGKPDINPIISEEEQNAIILKWEAVKNDGGAPLVGYQVECNRLGTPIWIHTSPPVIAKAELILTGLEPGYRYQFRVSAENAVGVSEPSEISDILNVSLDKAAVAIPKFTEGLRDATAMENDKVEFKVCFEGMPPPTISWFKDGYEIFSSRRTAITTDRNTSILIFHQTSLNDEGEIKCTATNRAGHIITRAKLQIESVPKVRLPRQYEDGLLYETNETIFFKVSVVGKPIPSVEWLHDGHPLSSNDRIEISNNDKFSILRINSATRNDRGEYHVFARNRVGQDVASFLVTITAKPDQPGLITVTSLDSNSVTLTWQPPDDDGGCKIGNYIIEYFRTGWDVWLKATTSRKLTTVINNLIEGSEYRFRVKAESPYGLSIPSEASAPVHIQSRTGSSTVISAFDVNTFEEITPMVAPRRKRILTPTPDGEDPTEEKIIKSSLKFHTDPKQSIRRKSAEPETKIADTNSTGSTEFMLVLVPDDGKKETDKRKSFQLDLEDALTPPPLSLSAPELGVAHFLPIRPLRNSVSSTELLHEHAMDRFYQAMAMKEAHQTQAKRDAIKVATLETPKIQIFVSDDETEDTIKGEVEKVIDTKLEPETEKIDNEIPTPSFNNWKSVSFDEDYSASTVSTGESDFSENESLMDDADRERDNIFSTEETTYHPKKMVPVVKESDDEEAATKGPPCDPNFVPKPILKRRKVENRKEVEEPKIEEKSEPKPEKMSIFKKITKPSFLMMKRDPKPKKVDKKVEESVVDNSKETKISKPDLKREEPEPLEEMDEGRIVIEHYGNIVKEYGQSKKITPPLYTNTDQLKKAAAQQEHAKPVKLPKSREQSVKKTKTGAKPKITKETLKIKPAGKSIVKAPSATKRPLSKTEHVLRATITIPIDYSELESEAKETVHSAIDYTIDVVMLLVAFWLFVFKDERFAVPILLITIYRQLHEAINRMIPPWLYDKLKWNE